MLNFTKINTEDMCAINKYLVYQDFRTCDFTAGAIFMWKDFFYSEYVIYKDMIIFKVNYPERGTSFSFPVGEGSTDEAMDALEKYSKERGIPLRLCTLPEKAKEYIKCRYGNKAFICTDRNWYDYLYCAEELKYFKGKKHHGQRNHINRFIREYPEYRYVRITEENLDRVIAMFDERFIPSQDEIADVKNEAVCARLYLNDFLKFGHSGGCIEVEGKIIAFAAGEVLKDTLYVHAERAITDYPGSYQMIVSEFAKDYASEGVIYINREDDAGDSGLRKSKLSYKPLRLLEKYCADIELPM